jgi:hypothetical protein
VIARWLGWLVIVSAGVVIVTSAAGVPPQRWELITAHACLIAWVALAMMADRR